MARSEIRCYSDYSTVAWADLPERYYRSNAADWDSEMYNEAIKPALDVLIERLNNEC